MGRPAAADGRRERAVVQARLSAEGRLLPEPVVEAPDR